MLKWLQFANDSKGARYELRYFRDKDGHEVDFVITHGTKPVFLVEVKLSDCSLHSGLKYLQQIVTSAKAFQIVGVPGTQRQYGEIHLSDVSALFQIREELIERKEGSDLGQI